MYPGAWEEAWEEEWEEAWGEEWEEVWEDGVATTWAGKKEKGEEVTGEEEEVGAVGEALAMREGEGAGEELKVKPADAGTAM